MVAPAALWPALLGDRGAYAPLRASVLGPIAALLQHSSIPASRAENLCEVSLALALWIREQKQASPLVVGISGAQGSGKSTLARLIGLILSRACGFRVARLSIDDLYKTRAERRELARTVHPLLLTRGVPGTHDTELGLDVIDAVCRAAERQMTLLPEFDKAVDERRPRNQWREFMGPADVVILEGWCVGAGPQGDLALQSPVNALEAKEDPDGSWRRYVNQQLGESYAALFGTLDRMIFLQVPDMECVYRWRSLQEQKLAAAITQTDPRHRCMDGAALRRFVMHFERLTRAMLLAMPQRADVTLALDIQHQFTHIQLLH